MLIDSFVKDLRRGRHGTILVLTCNFDERGFALEMPHRGQQININSIVTDDMIKGTREKIVETRIPAIIALLKAVERLVSKNNKDACRLEMKSAHSFQGSADFRELVHVVNMRQVLESPYSDGLHHLDARLNIFSQLTLIFEVMEAEEPAPKND